MGRFDDRIILITGAAHGQGAEEATRCIEEGGIVFLADIDDEAGTALAGSLGARAHYLRLDVGQQADWQRAMAEIAKAGPLYGLVNNAAIYRPQPLLDTSVASFDQHVQINLRGSFLGMQHAARAMAAAGSGTIVNISSTAGLRASPGSFAYSATKWGLRGMTLSAAAGLAAQGIRVNAVYPGPIDTDMLKVKTADELAARVKRVPMARLGTCSEVAAAVLFLLSDDSAYMTGAELTVDGGATL
ncbi:SDR family NAD(P)-dependent oxidoreductase [Bordetella genomosp. 13]|uniref:SDR family NAD(P)-dependent oxidoreductase n=1 Tax=Bordetella genomosp. 13 TaxID=463040 RepID=UPI00119CDDDF|nr:SDR family oxidoreductase [Bordetella genomosp. 13]